MIDAVCILRNLRITAFTHVRIYAFTRTRILNYFYDEQLIAHFRTGRPTIFIVEDGVVHPFNRYR